MEEQNRDLLLEKLLKQVGELTKKVNELETLKNDIPTAEELMTHEAKKEAGLSLSGDSKSSFNRTLFKAKRKRGRGARPLLESEIKEAQSKAVSAAHAARILNVSFNTYKKYAEMYGIHTLKNKCAKGIVRGINPNKGKYPLNDILEGKYPDYPIYRLKDKLIRAKLKPPYCEQCGYGERRLTDGKTPLLLVFEDGNSRNHKLENITLLCYNCTFTSGRIWMKCKDRKKWINDPDRIQGANTDTIQKF